MKPLTEDEMVLVRETRALLNLGLPRKQRYRNSINSLPNSLSIAEATNLLNQIPIRTEESSENFTFLRNLVSICSGINLIACRTLVAMIDRSENSNDEFQFAFDAAKLELDDLLTAQQSRSKGKQRGRQQPDHPITIWYRKNGSKYDNKKIAVAAYVQLNGGNEAKLYSDLNNQRSRLKSS